MSDTLAVPGTDLTTSAGHLLREAREAAGLHIVALAAALKVPVRKLEALEADRWEELTDATFVRALAGSVARHLKIDAAPILRKLPTSKTAPIEVPDDLGRANSTSVSFSLQTGIPKVAWLVLALLLAALTLYMLPDSAFKQLASLGSVAPTADAPVSRTFPVSANDASSGSAGVESDGAAQGKGVIEQPDSAVKPTAAPTEPASITALSIDQLPDKSVSAVAPVAAVPVNAVAATGASSPLMIKATADTWIDVIGQDGKPRAQRLLKSGETAEFNDSPTFAVVIGNVIGAKVWIKGQEFDLSQVARNNIARFDVK